MSGMSWSNRIAFGCVVFFALVFLIGAGAPLIALPFVIAKLGAERGYFAVSVQVFFLFLAVAFCYLVYRAYPRLRAEDIQRRERPDEPWTGRPDWDGVTRPAGLENAARAARMTAAIYVALCLPLVYFIPKFLIQGEYANLAVAGFALGGWMVARFARRSMRCFQRYGEAELRLASPTGFIGGELSGAFRVRHGIAPGETIDIVLRCIQCRVIRKHESTERIHTDLWRYVARLPVVHEGAGQGVQFEFTIPIPEDLPPVGDADADLTINWQLDFLYPDEDTPLACSFDAPVFLPPGDEKAQPPTQPTIPTEDPHAGYNPRVVRLGTSPEGDLLVHSPAWRHPEMASVYMTLLAFSFAVLCQAPVQDTQFGVLMSGGVGLLFVLVFVYMLWEHATDVRTQIRDGEIQVVTRTFFWTWEDSYSKKEVRVIEAINAGSRSGNRLAYHVVIGLNSGLHRRLIPQIPSEQDADRLALLLQEAFDKSDTSVEAAEA